MNSKGFEFSFAWLFALFVGIAIISLAIYAASQISSSGSAQYNSEVSAQLGVILNPIETSLETSKTYPIVFSQDTRLVNGCDDNGNFGTQTLKASVKSSVGKTWSEAGVPAKFSNKYIFSAQNLEGKNMYFIVKPFEFPYKVGNIMIVLDKKYCFVNPPEEMSQEIESWNVPLVSIQKSIGACASDAISVCFNGNCDVNVQTNGDSGRVIKDRKTLEYYGSLMYGAIFSDASVYNCQVIRLRKRAAEIADLYNAKTNILSAEGCSSNLAPELDSYARHLKDEDLSLRSLTFESQQIYEENERLVCPLF